MLTVKDSLVVTIDYTLTSQDGTPIDSSATHSPLVYLHGANNILPGLEEGLENKAVGERVTLTIPPEKGYGPIQETQLIPVPRDTLPTRAPLVPGASFLVELEDGSQRTVWIARVTDRVIYLDTNHPLAGQTLHFEVTVRNIRDATAMELKQGYPG